MTTRTRSMDEFAAEFSSHRFPFGYEFHDDGWVGSPHGACYLLALRGWTDPPTAGDRDLSFGYIRGPVWVVKLWSAVSARADLALTTSMAWSPDDLPEHCLLGDTSAVVGFVGVEHLTVSHVLVGAEVTMVATASGPRPRYLFMDPRAAAQTTLDFVDLLITSLETRGPQFGIEPR